MIVVGSLLVALAIVMVACAAVVGVLQGMLWTSAPASATETHTFTTSGTPTVTLQMSAGNVHVVKSDDGTVTATLYKEVHAITHAAAQQALSQTTLGVSQSADNITLIAHIPSFGINLTALQRSVDLTLSVPTQANLDLTLNAGNTDITNVAGTLDVTMNAGNLTLRNVQAKGASSLHVNAGNLDYRGSLDTTAALDASVDAGNATVELPPTTPTHLVARTSAGNITAQGWATQPTTLTHSNSTLSVDLNAQPTNTLTVQVSFGNVTVRPGA